MAGGYFNYAQFHINEIIDGIEHELEKQGKPKSKEDLWGSDEYFLKYPEEKFYHKYPEEVQEKMREGIKALKIAVVYAQGIDYFLSGDDGEENFLKRLERDLLKIK